MLNSVSGPMLASGEVDDWLAALFVENAQQNSAVYAANEHGLGGGDLASTSYASALPSQHRHTRRDPADLDSVVEVTSNTNAVAKKKCSEGQTNRQRRKLKELAKELSAVQQTMEQLSLQNRQLSAKQQVLAKFLRIQEEQSAWLELLHHQGARNKQTNVLPLGTSQRQASAVVSSHDDQHEQHTGLDPSQAQPAPPQPASDVKPPLTAAADLTASSSLLAFATGNGSFLPGAPSDMQGVLRDLGVFEGAAQTSQLWLGRMVQMWRMYTKACAQTVVSSQLGSASRVPPMALRDVPGGIGLMMQGVLDRQENLYRFMSLNLETEQPCTPPEGHWRRIIPVLSLTEEQREHAFIARQIFLGQLQELLAARAQLLQVLNNHPPNQLQSQDSYWPTDAGGAMERSMKLRESLGKQHSIITVFMGVFFETILTGQQQALLAVHSWPYVPDALAIVTAMAEDAAAGQPAAGVARAVVADKHQRR